MGVIFMALEELLAAEFAKITNDNEKTSEGSTVYGTITKTEDKYYVILDGSDGVLTPISGSTFNYAEGDRVSCTIKNHSLTVMGNVTQPGLTKADDIEDGTIEPVKLVDGSLKVGVNVEMGSNVVLSWENLPSDVASDNDIPTKTSELTNDSGYANSATVTTITKDAISTATIKCEQLKGGFLGGGTYNMSFDDRGFSVNSGEQPGGSISITGQTTSLFGFRTLNLSASNLIEMETSSVTVTDPYGGSAGTINANLNGNATSATSATSATKASYVSILEETGNEDFSVRSYYKNSTNVQLRAHALSSSLRKNKKDIEPIRDDILDPNRLYDVEVVQFKYNDSFPISDDDWRKDRLLAGFIVDDLVEIYPNCIERKLDGSPRMWDSDFIIPPMLKLIQDQKKKIDELEERLSKLEAIVTVQNGD